MFGIDLCRIVFYKLIDYVFDYDYVFVYFIKIYLVLKFEGNK